jgi:lipoprotein-anchoring transpeptidase ErfK/SrfK
MRTIVGTIIRLSIAAVVLAAVAGAQAAEPAPSAAPSATGPSVTPSASPASPPPTQAPSPSLARRNPDPVNPSGDLIEVSIAKQRLTAWRDGRVAYRFVVSTGRPGFETPTGHYRILEKYETRWSRKWSVWMPFAMRWHDGYFIHQLPHKPGSSWNIGATKLGRPDSHGCVRVDVGDAEALFQWTAVGTPVWVH